MLMSVGVRKIGGKRPFIHTSFQPSNIRNKIMIISNFGNFKQVRELLKFACTYEVCEGSWRLKSEFGRPHAADRPTLQSTRLRSQTGATEEED